VRADADIALFDTSDPAAFAVSAAPGVIEFAARGDHAHIHPTLLQSSANKHTLTFTDDGTDGTLANNTGDLIISPADDLRMCATRFQTIGVGTAADAISKIKADFWTDSSSASCMRFTMTAASNGGAGYGILGAIQTGTTATQGTGRNAGIFAQATARGNKTIASLEGLVVDLAWGSSSGASSVVTDGFGVLLRTPARIASGTFGTVTGLKMEAMPAFVTNHWALYSSNSPSRMGDDDVKTFWGTANDASQYYNGTNMIIDPAEIGAGFVNIGTGSVGGTDRKLRCGECNVTGALNHDGASVGFFNTAPVAQAAAYTQTYSTASRTVPNPIAVQAVLTPTNGGWGWATEAQAQAVDDNLNALVGDVVYLRQLINALIDDSQAYGLAQ
jgi:hypothetical protein